MDHEPALESGPSRKPSADSLAIVSGHPSFPEPLFVGRPNIGNRESFMARVEDLLARRWLTNAGRYVSEFEERIAATTGARHCIAVCNATIGLELAIRALEMSGEVIVPSFTFVATAHALQWQAITPVFCDIAPGSHHIDPDRVEALITPRTTGIVGVHLWGRACDVDRLEEIAARRGLALLFDASHALGCTHGGRRIGSFGRAEVFSFHATKFLNTFEGGAITTDDDGLAQKLRLMKNFGFAGYDNVVYLGTNGKMTEISAAMGLSSLECMDVFTEVNRRNYHTYRNALGDIPGLRLVDYDEREESNYQYVVLEVDEAVAGLSRDLLLRVLHAENVIARRYFHPGCHRMEPYRSYYPNAGLLLPETERATQRVLALPTGTAVSEDDIARVAQIIRTAVACSPEIRSLGLTS